MESLHNIHSFCKCLPKVELHAHLNGSIREHTLVELAKERNVVLPTEFLLHEGEHHDPDREVLLFNTKPRSLRECFDIFSYIPKCVNDLTALRRITYEVLLDCAKDNVAYIELRTGPKALLCDHHSEEVTHCTKKQYVEAIISIMQEFERAEQRRFQHEVQNENKFVRMPLIPRLIISVDRSGTLDQARENIALALDMFRSGQKIIVGVELGGNPTQNDFRQFEPAFAEMARKEGLPISIHCGELPMGSNEFEKDPSLLKAYQEAASIIHFKPDRLGHALLLSDSLMETLLQQQHIPIECCPTSNIMTLELALHHGGNLIDGMKKHPQLGKWLNASYPFSINTDDSGLFCTNQTRELLLVAKAYNLGKSELGNIIMDSIEHIFDPHAETKLRLKRDVRERIENMTAACGC